MSGTLFTERTSTGSIFSTDISAAAIQPPLASGSITILQYTLQEILVGTIGVSHFLIRLKTLRQPLWVEYIDHRRAVLPGTKHGGYRLVPSYDRFGRRGRLQDLTFPLVQANQISREAAIFHDRQGLRQTYDLSEKEALQYLRITVTKEVTHYEGDT